MFIAHSILSVLWNLLLCWHFLYYYILQIPYVTKSLSFISTLKAASSYRRSSCGFVGDQQGEAACVCWERTFSCMGCLECDWILLVEGDIFNLVLNLQYDLQNGRMLVEGYGLCQITISSHILADYTLFVLHSIKDQSVLDIVYVAFLPPILDDQCHYFGVGHIGQ